MRGHKRGRRGHRVAEAARYTARSRPPNCTEYPVTRVTAALCRSAKPVSGVPLLSAHIPTLSLGCSLSAGTRTLRPRHVWNRSGAEGDQ